MDNMESPGARLKKIRQEKGLSLEEVQKRTKIHLNILKALEGDSLTDLSPIYLKGFLKIYCKFLGVDPKDYILEYKEPQSKVSLNINSDKPQAAQTPKSRTSFLKAALLVLNSVKSVFNKFKMPLMLIIIFIFVAIGLFNLGKFISSRHRAHLLQKRTASSARINKESKKAIKTSKAITAKAKPALAESRAAKETYSGIRLGIRARENCWVSLKADGKVVFQRILEKGRFESWLANDKIELSLGNAGAVELEVNGQIFSNLGRKGQALKNIRITKEGISISR